MVITKEKTNPNKTARIAGGLYLLLLPLGILGLIYVPATLIVPGDVATTASNIMANESLFRLSIVSALLIQVVNLFVVLFLYKLLKPVNKNMALVMVIFILLGAPIAMLTEVNRAAALLLLNTADLSPALAALFLDLHEVGIQIASIFWGLWLFPMGYLVFKSGYIPKMIGVLLIIGCFGYLADSFAFFLFPNFGMTISQFTFIGELVLPLWLLIKGVNVAQWEKFALQPA
jgi:hypothetical protein